MTAENSLRTTVLCAVWHGDPERRALLDGHRRNLDAQTVACERVYVFDGGDAPPAELDGTTIAVNQPLTIYEAWNLALTLVRTPYVMNLNLDDRLAPDALARLEEPLDAGADLAGGDWWICHSRADTDTVAPCRPSAGLPFVDAWPPSPARPSRLGSAGERGTFGPATIWRAALHAELGRYPSRFGDGSPIRIIGDSLWWHALGALGKRCVRLPVVIGNYQSHPETQAEFRGGSAAEEHAHARRHGLIFL
jgi:hypothetical protein